MTTRRYDFASVDTILFVAVAMFGAVLVRYEITGMLGDGVAFLGTATALVGVWIGARVDRRGTKRDHNEWRDTERTRPKDRSRRD